MIKTCALFVATAMVAMEIGVATIEVYKLRPLLSK